MPIIVVCPSTLTIEVMKKMKMIESTIKFPKNLESYRREQVAFNLYFKTAMSFKV